MCVGVVVVRGAVVDVLLVLLLLVLSFCGGDVAVRVVYVLMVPVSCVRVVVGVVCLAVWLLLLMMMWVLWACQVNCVISLLLVSMILSAIAVKAGSAVLGEHPASSRHNHEAPLQRKLQPTTDLLRHPAAKLVRFLQAPFNLEKESFKAALSKGKTPPSPTRVQFFAKPPPDDPRALPL